MNPAEGKQNEHRKSASSGKGRKPSRPPQNDSVDTEKDPANTTSTPPPATANISHTPNPNNEQPPLQQRQRRKSSSRPTKPSTEKEQLENVIENNATSIANAANKPESNSTGNNQTNPGSGTASPTPADTNKRRKSSGGRRKSSGASAPPAINTVNKNVDTNTNKVAETTPKPMIGGAKGRKSKSETEGITKVQGQPKAKMTLGNVVDSAVTKAFAQSVVANANANANNTLNKPKPAGTANHKTSLDRGSPPPSPVDTNKIKKVSGGRRMSSAKPVPPVINNENENTKTDTGKVAEKTSQPRRVSRVSKGEDITKVETKAHASEDEKQETLDVSAPVPEPIPEQKPQEGEKNKRRNTVFRAARPRRLTINLQNKTRVYPDNPKLEAPKTMRDEFQQGTSQNQNQRKVDNMKIPPKLSFNHHTLDDLNPILIKETEIPKIKFNPKTHRYPKHKPLFETVTGLEYLEGTKELTIFLRSDPLTFTTPEILINSFDVLNDKGEMIYFMAEIKRKCFLCSRWSHHLEIYSVLGEVVMRVLKRNQSMCNSHSKKYRRMEEMQPFIAADNALHTAAVIMMHEDCEKECVKSEDPVAGYHVRLSSGRFVGHFVENKSVNVNRNPYKYSLFDHQFRVLYQIQEMSPRVQGEIQGHMVHENTFPYMQIYCEHHPIGKIFSGADLQKFGIRSVPDHCYHADFPHDTPSANKAIVLGLVAISHCETLSVEDSMCLNCCFAVSRTKCVVS